MKKLSPIHANIKFLREYSDLSQEEFGKKFKVNRASVNQYEKGVTNPGAEFVLSLMSFYGLTDHQLYKEYLTAEAITQRGTFMSVLEVQLEEARKQLKLKDQIIEDKERTIKDKERIIGFLEGKNVRQASVKIV